MPNTWVRNNVRISNGAANELELVVVLEVLQAPRSVKRNVDCIGMHGKGIKIYSYGTKGDKDNIKRLTKRSARLIWLLSPKGLAKANDKQKKGMSGLIALGKLGATPFC